MALEALRVGRDLLGRDRVAAVDLVRDLAQVGRIARQLVRAARVPTLATSGYAAQRLYDIDLRQPVAWIFGHEGQGVADDLLSLATHKVVIPHLGQVESLNVAACAAVCFFEQVRQNQS